MTDVPYGRGGSPLQNLIMDGKTETQVTALRMTEEMDAGPVYVKRPMSLEGRAEEIYLRAGAISWDLIFWMIANKPKPIPQTTVLYEHPIVSSTLPSTSAAPSTHSDKQQT